MLPREVLALMIGMSIGLSGSEVCGTDVSALSMLEEECVAVGEAP